MQINKSKFSQDAALTLGAVYVVCSLFVYLLPEFSAKLMQWLTHVTIGGARSVTLAGFAAGLVQVLVYGYIGAWIFAWVFNRAAKE